MSESGIETRTCGHHTWACHRTNPCLDELGVSGEISNFQRSFTNNRGQFTDYQNLMVMAKSNAVPQHRR
jgi:hypothetical protein